MTATLLAIAWITRSMIVTGLVLGYLGAGLAAGVHLARRGHAIGLVATALLGWPLLISVMLGAPEVRTRTPIAGPFAARIDQGLISLRAGLAEAHAESPIELASASQLASLELALRQADERIASVDRLIAELQRPNGVGFAIDDSLSTLVRARHHAADELEQVLAMLLQVRVQIGLHALAGPAGVAPVRERLAELEARTAALAELSSFDASMHSVGFT